MARKKTNTSLDLYPVEATALAIPLGFSLGSAVEHVIIAPYHDGARDCQTALMVLDFERQCPQAMIPAPYYFAWRDQYFKLEAFLSTAKGDVLWQDIASNTSGFFESLKKYLRIPDAEFLHEMEKHILELKRVLDLRDTTGQIYEGMTGLPEVPDAGGE